MITKENIEGLNQKTFKNWNVRFDSHRPEKDAWLYALILLTGIKIMPKFLIKKINKLKVFQKNSKTFFIFAYLLKKMFNLVNSFIYN